jgi:hypothetical protein
MKKIELTLELDELKNKKRFLESEISRMSYEIDSLQLMIAEKLREIDYEDINNILYNDLNGFIEKIKIEHPQIHYVVEQCSGLLGETKTLHEAGKELGLTMERARQLYGQFFKKFNTYRKSSAKSLKNKISELLQNFKDPELFFKDIRSMFSNSGDFYSFLEKLSDCDKDFYPFMPKNDLPHKCYNNKVFDEYCINQKLPISHAEACQLIQEEYKCAEITTYFICFNLIKKGWAKLTDNGIIPLIPSVTAMIAQAALYFPEGASDTTIKHKANEIFSSDFTEKDSGELLQAAKLGYVYLYGDASARHTQFFEEEYNEELINQVLNKAHVYINSSDEKSCRIKEVVQNCFNDSIHYYDLRHIIKEYGEKHSNPIYFVGKSSKDIVFLK